MKVIWAPEALQDRLDIWEYIATESPSAAVHMDKLFSAAASTPADFPQKGRLGSVAGTRELIPHENYRLVYQAETDAVWILALVHVARMWPPLQG
ncbi:MAG: type II toxin-antitoxin system RelE/ParE family toxin [Pseudomonas sp.]|uniref:type II toxin-antitoxin system RelE/ParE family toxin n=1 Tax=Pseudomonas sp. TaxID=306 RepID=UPI00271CE10F|nr:type II toxin-antitoxin system RelE/ParE family toxin [Pseudomonas sp.]MDO9617705.1 type II toxin-antitoxin system RelE/ParE family toxin [Pseudomonas sp.]MDP2446089.1 type II toxin-antitoxin system RelE/ParE family toxin [Pseudomonas sp.]MDZ4334199.1 type II toxin-antitoxin system RelE/ParE family toxin [Pseudomonas sp.]